MFSCSFPSIGDKGDVGPAGPPGPVGPKGDPNPGARSRPHIHNTNYAQQTNLLFYLIQALSDANASKRIH